MADPLFLAAAAFFTVIVLGSLLVAVSDWLEGRLADPRLATGVGLRRGGRPLSARAGRQALCSAIRRNRAEPQSKRRDLLVDWF